MRFALMLTLGSRDCYTSYVFEWTNIAWGLQKFVGRISKLERTGSGTDEGCEKSKHDEVSRKTSNKKYRVRCGTYHNAECRFGAAASRFLERKRPSTMIPPQTRSTGKSLTFGCFEFLFALPLAFATPSRAFSYQKVYETWQAKRKLKSYCWGIWPTLHSTWLSIISRWFVPHWSIWWKFQRQCEERPGRNSDTSVGITAPLTTMAGIRTTLLFRHRHCWLSPPHGWMAEWIKRR